MWWETGNYSTNWCGKEEQGVLQKEIDEFLLSLHQSREAELQMSQKKETLEQEFSDVNEARQQENMELERKEAAIKKETTELQEVKGRLQLQLKMCKSTSWNVWIPYVCRLQVQLHAVHTNEALLHSAIDGTVSISKSALPQLSEGVAEVLPTID